ncbi:MAG: 6-pyruvoyl trahydropterin synthase family protein, partial [Bacteroidia bacterium]
MNIRVTKEFKFEMAHALLGHDGPCKNIHGHSYQLSVTLKGKPINDPSNPKTGMVVDFIDLKKL